MEVKSKMDVKNRKVEIYINISYLWFVRIEHGHFNILASYGFWLPLDDRRGRLLIVTTNTDKEEQKSNCQRNCHTGDQDIKNLHLGAFFGIWLAIEKLML